MKLTNLYRSLSIVVSILPVALCVRTARLAPADGPDRLVWAQVASGDATFTLQTKPAPLQQRCVEGLSVFLSVFHLPPPPP